MSDEESLFDALLRNDIEAPYACKAGVCHVCVMARVVEKQHLSKNICRIQLKSASALYY